MILIDLSHPFDPEHQADPGPAGLRLERLKTVARDGVNTMHIGLGNHIGTHINAPLHLIENGAAVDELPLDTYYGTAAVLDLRREQNEGVTAQDLAGAKPAVERGDIVVALIGDEATVKYFHPERDYVRFQPANSQMAPILVRASDFKSTMLLGKVVGVYRRL